VLASVSTVKDTQPNLRRFVERNLASGIDHMFIFLDAPEARCERYLADHPHVTAVVTTETWWNGARPEGLNRRKITNADVIRALLTRYEWATWLFHIDGDEIVRIDRERVEALGSDVTVLHLQPVEAVSRYRATRPRYFKRLLSEDELVLLTALGSLARPDNHEYFHGHVVGKSGMRPALDVYAGTHRPRDESGNVVTGLEADWLAVLHLESPSGAEFVRKWANLSTSGPRPRTRSSRTPLLVAIEALNSLDVEARARKKILAKLYRLTTEDDLPLLRDLGLVESIDLDERRYSPRQLGEPVKAEMALKLAAATSMDKQVFRTGSPQQMRESMTQMDW